ncbi:MAG: 3-phosphoshikimate 1-carboxyvinyltransferase [Prevotella sp.]|nr:3-phosphoshikimate 1-carboxyvinyltransferase [Prevotella sp.]
MTYAIQAPDQINTTIDLPASKSISNRALIVRAFGGGPMPENLSDCDDTEVVIRAMTDRPEVINIHAAGTAMRFLTAYLSSQPESHTITGTERMLQRPIGLLVDALRHLGADIQYVGKEGYPPLCIHGRQLDGGYIEIDGGVSSQFISALLMAAPMMTHGIEMRLTGEIISRPYIDLTLCVMRDYGALADWTRHDTITVQPHRYQQRDYLIENDWSAASYWYEVMALMQDGQNEIRLTGLTDGSKQGDSAVRYMFSMLGVKTTFADTDPNVPTTITLNRSFIHTPRMTYDFVNQPDLTQTLVVTCALLNIPFHFTGLSTLRIKETDRIEALKNEMLKLGYVLHDANDSELYWDGERVTPMENPVINTYNDHRMAMAFAPAAIRIPGLRIDDPDVVTKSYPQFWRHMRHAGFTLTPTP